MVRRTLRWKRGADWLHAHLKRVIFIGLALTLVAGLASMPGCSSFDDETTPSPSPMSTPADPDGDGDGFAGDGQDCDDADADTYPGAEEVCDGKDNDCDALVDEIHEFYVDADGDEHGDDAEVTYGCKLPEGYAVDMDDCNDADPSTYPGADELCDATDNDCDGIVDEGATAARSNPTWAEENANKQLQASGSVAALPAPLVAPLLLGAETCATTDQDGDGWTVGQDDCDDTNASIHPGASEICDYRDNDCDGYYDEDVPAPSGSPVWYPDADKDGYGTAGQTVTACFPPAGYSGSDRDCDDTNGAIHPGASEPENGIDDDCDGRIDEEWIAVSAGDGHALALSDDGSIWAWGSNTWGELGDGSSEDQLTPVQVTVIQDAVSVAAGADCSLALRRDGTVWGWGSNKYYALGEGQPGSIPNRINDLEDVVAISAGTYHGLAVTMDGTAWVWGGGYPNSPDDAPTPWPVPEPVTFVAIAGGVSHSLALASDGSVWVWEASEDALPYRMPTLSGIVAVSAGWDFSLAADDAGRVWGWGRNNYGQLGDGTTEDRVEPVLAVGLDPVVEVDAGESHAIARSGDGTVSAWGNNIYGQLGIGSTENRIEPVKLSGLPGMAAVSAGDFYSLGASRDGEVWAWGSNMRGQLGTGSTCEVHTPTASDGPADFAVVIAAGDDHAMSISADGALMTWTHNLGEEADGMRYMPEVLSSIGTTISIAAGNDFSLAADIEGSVWAWGYNNEGQLGDGTTTTSRTPVQALGLPQATMVAAGEFHSLALDGSGHVWAWGWNSHYQLGTAAVESSTTALEVKGIDRVIAIDAGDYVSLALRDDQTVWGWGSGAAGQLGTGTGKDSPVPVRISGLSGIVAIAAGAAHILALDADGAIWAWGWNEYGQLGVKGGDSYEPVLVSEACPAKAIGAGDYHSIALCEDRRVMVWGSDDRGQQGDGIDRYSSRPKVYPLQVSADWVSAGGNATFVGTSTGVVYASGDNCYAVLAMNPGWAPLKVKTP